MFDIVALICGTVVMVTLIKAVAGPTLNQPIGMTTTMKMIIKFT